jgi:glutamyl-tRNA synthetase
VAHHLGYFLGKMNIDPMSGPAPAEVVLAQRERAKTLLEMAENSAFFYREPDSYNPKDAEAHLKPEIAAAMADLRQGLASLPLWAREEIHRIVNETAERHGLKLGKIAQPVRVAIAGRAMSPPIDVTLQLVGRERTLQRLDKALDFIKNISSAA